MFALISLLGLIVCLVGIFFLLFKTGKRFRGVFIAIAGLIIAGVGGGLQASNDAKEAGFASVSDMQMAKKAGISDPKEFEARRTAVEAALKAEEEAIAKAKRLAEQKKQEEQTAAAETARLADAESQARQAAEDAYFQSPRVQVAFVEKIEQARTLYDAAANELAKGGVRRDRAKALCAIQKGTRVTHWSGKLTELTTNGDGLGVLEVEIGPNVTVKTMNNAFSDIGSGTLIDPDTKVFRLLSTLKEGDRVLFSGQFVKNSAAVDCFWEGSLTMDGAMADPEFIFRFAEVKTLEP